MRQNNAIYIEALESLEGIILVWLYWRAIESSILGMKGDNFGVRLGLLVCYIVSEANKFSHSK